jgi:long-chain fatty acid transport protein
MTTMIRYATALALLLSPIAAHAAGFAVTEQSALAGGTGGAGVARASDPAAAWFNPAATAGRPGLSASAGLLVLFPGIEASAADGSWDQGLTTSPRLPPHFYVSYGRGPFAGGVAVNVPFGTAVTWPETWPGRYEAVLSQLQVIRVAPFVAWSFMDMIRVGVGFHVDAATLQVRRRLDFMDTDGSMALDFADVGVGGHASLHLDLGRMVSLGASYKSRTMLSFEGSARFDAPLAFSQKAHDQQARADYTLPDLITLGVEVRPLRGLSAVLDLGVTVWSVYQQLAIDFESEDTPDTAVQNEWETRLSVRTGLEYRPLSWLALRLGMFYDPTPVPASTLAPTSPDSDRLGVTAGLGAELPWNLAVDAFYGYVHMLGQSAENPENLQADYAGRMQLLGFGLRYRWGG